MNREITTTMAAAVKRAINISYFLLPLFLLLLLCNSPVSSNSNVKNGEDDQFAQLTQAFHVFTKGGNRRLVEDIAIKFSNYFFNTRGRGLIAVVPPTPAPAPAPAPCPGGGGGHGWSDLECDGLCKERCSLHSRPNVCKRACGTCCIRCKCVPPGTSGNREVCGKCYTDMTTHGNRTKCP